MLKRSILIPVGIILAAAMMRLVPHPWNVTPVAAMALFGGACFDKRFLAFLVPLAAMAVSDILLGLTTGWGIFHSTLPFVYGAFALTVVLGMLIRDRATPLRIGGATIAATVLFFLVTNFGVWATQPLYPPTFEGLIACYVAALPFLLNSLLGNAFYVTLLFGGLEVIERRLATAREAGA